MKLRTVLTRILLLGLVLSLALTGAGSAEEAINDLVLTPRDEIGKYGGTLYAAFPSAYAGQGYETLGFYEPILAWNEDETELIPNLVESYEQSEDAKTFTFTIRQGLKWSNGDPVTTEDVRYVYEDVWHNPDLMAAFPTAFTAGGELCQLNIVDDRTFELIFSVSNPWFKYIICREANTAALFVPSNYLRQFNNKYVDEETLTQMAAEESLDSWQKLYEDRQQWKDNPDCPTLYAWRLASVSEDNLVRVFERNPYYFKVDTEGNRLPYIDNVQLEYVDNSETLKLKVMSGEVDYIYAPTGETFSEWPVLAQNAQAGNYRLILASADYPSIFILFPNLASQDPQKGPLLANKDFRIALSHAINREEFIDLLVSVADFRGTPAQQSPIEDSPFYNERLATQYTEYDPELANEILDSLGLAERDADGYRLGPDGEPMAFQLTVPTYNDLWVDGGILIAEYWKEVGLNVEAKAVAPDIFNQMNTANELEFCIFSTGSGGMMFINEDGVNSYSVPMAGAPQFWGTAYATYITTNGESGIEPPEFVYEMNALRDAILYEADEEVSAQKMTELLELNADVFNVIGISRQLPQFLVCSNDLKNTPQDYEAWVIFPYGVGGNVNPCQFYLDR